MIQDPRDLSKITAKQVVWCVQLGSCYVESIDTSIPTSPTSIVCRQHVGRRKAKFTLSGRRKNTDIEQSLFLRSPYYYPNESGRTFPRMMFVKNDRMGSWGEAELIIGEIGGKYVSLFDSGKHGARIKSVERLVELSKVADFAEDIEAVLWDMAKEVDETEADRIKLVSIEKSEPKYPRFMKVSNENGNVFRDRLVCFEHGGKFYATDTLVTKLSDIDELETISLMPWSNAEELPNKVVKKLTMEEIARHFGADEIEII